MKILFAIKALDHATGGAERVLCDVASGLAKKGYDVSVLDFDRPGGTSFYPLHEKVRRRSLGIGDVTQKSKLFEIVTRIRAIRKDVLQTKPDICIAFMHSTFILTAFALIGTNVPVIASEHIVPEHYKDRIWEYRLLMLSCFFVQKITVLSEAIKKSYPRFLQRKMIAISNPVCPAKVLAETSGTGVDRKIILNVGRLTPQKNQKMLIEAFADFSKDYPDWDVHIVGEGELRQDLEETIRKNNLEDRILLPGAVSEIEQEYQKAHIFALPSTYESFGLATAEAMAHGLPTIGLQRCPGTNELIIHEQNGFLVAEDNEFENLKTGLKKLMESATLRKDLGTQGLETVKKFAPENILKQWETIILSFEPSGRKNATPSE